MPELPKWVRDWEKAWADLGGPPGVRGRSGLQTVSPPPLKLLSGRGKILARFQRAAAVVGPVLSKREPSDPGGGPHLGAHQGFHEDRPPPGPEGKGNRGDPGLS